MAWCTLFAHSRDFSYTIMSRSFMAKCTDVSVSKVSMDGYNSMRCSMVTYDASAATSTRRMTMSNGIQCRLLPLKMDLGSNRTSDRGQVVSIIGHLVTMASNTRIFSEIKSFD